MTEEQSALSRRERRLPLDLSGVVVLTIALNVVVFASLDQITPLRVLLGFLFVVFAPGYALIAAVYPGRSRAPDAPNAPLERTSIWGAPPRPTITTSERFLLAVAFSIIIVPAIGYAFNFTDGGVRLEPVLVASSAFTVGAAVVAAARRYRLPATERFSLQLSPRRMRSLMANTWRTDRRTAVVNAVLVLAVLFFVASAGYSMVEAPSGGGYSEIYLTDSGQRADEFVESNISSRLASGERQHVGVAVGNHEGRPVDYSVVVVQQTVTPGGEQLTVRDQTQLGQFDMEVAAGETRVREFSFTPSAGEDTRIVWLLYPDDVPTQPSTENTEYHVHLWVGDSDSNATPAANRRTGGQDGVIRVMDSGTSLRAVTDAGTRGR